LLEEKPGTGVVTAWLKEFGMSHRVVKVSGGDVRNFLIENNSVHGLFKKELWQACGKYDEQMPAYEDWDFWLRITGMGYRVEVIPAAYFFYRVHKYPSLLKAVKGKHLELFRYIVEKNKSIYQKYMVDALCIAEEKLINEHADPAPGNLLHKVKRRLRRYLQ
jgi:GT2 family glycosyltransferase